MLRKGQQMAILKSVFLLCKICLFVCALDVTEFGMAADATVPLQIDISKVRNQKGQVCAIAFRNKIGFPDKQEHAFRAACVAAKEGHLTLSLPDIPPGEYAFSAMHDENADHKLTTKALGIPKEGVGLSRNPKPKMAAPLFENSAMEIKQTNPAIEMILRYPPAPKQSH